MEIARYPHYENVCSNILRFFLDPAEKHGLGTLFLDVLARVSNFGVEKGAFGGEITVEREVVTDKRNRIDLLIESDGAFILIENKIFAAVDNPFDDYDEYLKKLVRAPHPKKQLLKLLLTLKPEAGGEKQEFRNVTYGDFVRGIRDHLGHYVAHANSRYVTFLLDFLNTVDNLLTGGEMTNNTFVELVSERQAVVKKFLAEIRKLRAELRQKVTELGQHIELTKYNNIVQYPWRQREWESLEDTLMHDVTRSDGLTIAIDTVVTPDGWKVQIFSRQSENPDISADLANSIKAKVEKLLKKAAFDIKVGELKRFELINSFPYEAKYVVIAETLNRLIARLSTNAIG
jgi:PD-(D/E)XK nuclease superfamily protein